jgi:uncharacterized protein
MNSLIEFQEILLHSVKDNFRRYLHQQIDWKQRMIAIKGPRGAGKTTLMLQRLKYDLGLPSDALYITADHTWFYTHTLFETANNWYRQGGKMLFIDEVHKYPKWSVELKNIYDGLPEMKVVFTASSALDIYRGEADLSRRVIHYSLAGLSFREYLLMRNELVYKSISFDSLVSDHRDICRIITQDFRPLPAFQQYLKSGYLPVFLEGEGSYLMKLNQIINTTVESDLSSVSPYNAGTAVKIKKLLGVIAESSPFKPNISAIARKLDLSRDSVYHYMQELKNAKLLNTLNSAGRGVSTLQKPEKIYLENTNLSFALKENPEIGNIRETFVLNQLLNSGQQVSAPKEGDFETNGWTIEVGGRNKNASQVKHLEKYLVASDDTETGSAGKIPIWLFGFLY